MSTDSDHDDGDVELQDIGDDKLDSLIDRVLDRAEERDDVELSRIEKKAIEMSRRGVLAGVAGAAGVGGLIGSSTTARAAGEDFTNASGTVGTDSQPLSEMNVKQADLQTADTTQLLIGGSNALISNAASGQTTLSSGTAVVDTGLSTSGATFYLALGIDDPNADGKVTGRLFWDDSTGTYKVEIVEDGTSIGNPTVNYDVLQVR